MSPAAEISMRTGRDAVISRVRRAALAWCGLALAATSCARREPQPVAPGPPAPVCIVQPAVLAPQARRGLAVLRGLYPAAPTFAMSDFQAAAEACLAEDRVMLLPHAEAFPTDLWEPLLRFIARGGRPILIGRRPFEARVRLAGGPRTGSELLEQLAAAAVPVAGLSDVQLWRHENDTGVMRGAVRVTPAPAPPWPSVEVDVVEFGKWDQMSSGKIEPDRIPPGANSLVLHARGGPRTSSLVVHGWEEDGSVWFRVLALTEQWQLYALHEEAFRHFHGGRDRGGPGDRLSFGRVRQLTIGLSMHLAPQGPGTHLFGLSDVRMATDERPPLEAALWPDMLTVSPPYRRYELTAYGVRPIGARAAVRTPGLRVGSPLPRPRGLGGSAAATYRWIPLFEAVDETGVVSGWPASICIAPVGGGAPGCWAWLGLDPAGDTAAVAGDMLTACVKRLHEGAFLSSAGCSRFVFRPREIIQVSAAWLSGPAPARPLRARAELLSGDGISLRRVFSTPPAGEESAGANRAELNLGLTPEPRERSADFTVRVTLEDAAGGRQAYDRIEQPIRVVGDAPPTNAPPALSATGPRFTIEKTPVFLTGVNYWPMGTTGRSADEYKRHWLEPGEFDPMLIARDLDRLKGMGVNTVAIQYHEESQAPQLRYFIEDARSRGIWVCAYVPGLSPLWPDLELARKLLDAAGLAADPQLFALDLAWEPRLGYRQERRRFDEAWRAWLVEQYGSTEHAEQVIGRPLWREEGLVTGPPDEELAADGDHRVAVANYRRFVDDYVSRRYGHIRRFLKDLGCRQLLTARSGFGGTGDTWPDPQFPLDLASGAVHLDFICPEGWGLTGPPERFLEAGFITAYARGVSDGKPVVWIEFGSSVGQNPQRADLENQARIYDGIFDMIQKSAAAGCFAWWYPPGFRLDEGSDMGLVREDGALRPAAESLRRWSRKLRGEGRSTRAWKGREVARSANARGISGLWDAWRATYREEMAAGAIEELRPLGYGRTTADIPLVAPGGVPFADPAPLECANGEWGVIEVNGAKQRRAPDEAVAAPVSAKLALELINTGSTAWLGSRQGDNRTVWARAEHAERAAAMIEVGNVPFGKSVRIQWVPPDPGAWRLRPYIQGVGAFGEPLVVNVTPAATRPE